MSRWMILTVLALAGSPLAAQEAAVRRAIERQNARLMDDINNAKDGRGVQAMYAEDSVLLPPNEPAVKGLQNVQRYWLEAMKTLSDFRIVTKDVLVQGSV